MTIASEQPDGAPSQAADAQPGDAQPGDAQMGAAAVGYALLMADVDAAVADAAGQIALLGRVVNQGFAALAAAPGKLPAADASGATTPPPSFVGASDTPGPPLVPPPATAGPASTGSDPVVALAERAEPLRSGASLPAPVSLSPLPLPDAAPFSDASWLDETSARPLFAPHAFSQIADGPGLAATPAGTADHQRWWMPSAAMAAPADAWPALDAGEQGKPERPASSPARTETPPPLPARQTWPSAPVGATSPPRIAQGVMAGPLAPVEGARLSRRADPSDAASATVPADGPDGHGPVPAGPTHGDVFLDGERVGHWLSDTMARAVGGPGRGSASFDPRLGPRWPGALQGH